jgi:hypothetical protein
MVRSRTRTQTRFVVLPPSKLEVPSIFRNVEVNNRSHDELFAEMQRFRGSVYKKDGAIQANELSADGRHRMSIDEACWHVLSLDSQGRVVSCLRYLDESQASSFDNLWVRHAALTRCPKLGPQFRTAVEDRMYRARLMSMRFGEVGGWAVAESHRWTLEPLRIILATYGLLELLGGSAGVATATFRHSSAMILRRIGLCSMEAEGQELPPYYDPHYRCQMEVLHYDSRCPNPKYRDWVLELADHLVTAPVVCRESFVESLQGFVRGFDLPMEPSLAAAAI